MSDYRIAGTGKANPKGIANHPIQPDEGVERVFVGIPDAPTMESVRIHALNLATDLHRFNGSDTEPLTRAYSVIDIARRYEAYILHGTT